jgi:hypothetical protein
MLPEIYEKIIEYFERCLDNLNNKKIKKNDYNFYILHFFSSNLVLKNFANYNSIVLFIIYTIIYHILK